MTPKPEAFDAIPVLPTRSTMMDSKGNGNGNGNSNRSSSKQRQQAASPQAAEMPAAMQPEMKTPQPTKKEASSLVVSIEDNNNNKNTTTNDEDDDVRRLAASLAPQVQELDELLTSPPPLLDSARGTAATAKSDDEDDGMGSEEQRLEASEQLLRQELDFAQDCSHLMASPLRDDHIARELAINYGAGGHGIDGLNAAGPDDEEALTEPDDEELPPTTTTTTIQPPPPSPQSYTIASHADALGLYVDSGGWYVVPASKLTGDDDDNNDYSGVFEYVVPLSVEHLKRLYIGIVGEQGETVAPSSIADPSNEEDGRGSGGIVRNSPAATPSSLSDTPQTPRTPTTTITGRNSAADETEVLPVRTVVMWIRPDVLCGAVMDAIHHALGMADDATIKGEITKRQGGHLRAIVRPSVTRTTTNDGHVTHCPGYLVDVQLCTYEGTASRNKQGQRSLILRVYHYYHPEGLLDDYNNTTDGNHGELDDLISCETTTTTDDRSNLLLKEAAALVQKMETRGGSADTNMTKQSALSSMFSSTKVYSTPADVRQAISQQLLLGYRPCPSVLDGRLTLPALSEQDMPVICASGRWIDACWNELENRDLCYSTLKTCRFGAFPALPTLDVHYCSQLRRLSREGMIVSLLKSASELEEYAREAEYACANLIQMLRPTFDAYEIEPPALPQPLPLTAYPLDFTPPQSTCPPWGMKVMEALTRVSAMTTEENAKDETTKSSFEVADESIQMVLKAFQQQDDEEQGARLGRKNVQVMDRLAKMQAHKRLSIAIIRDSYGRNLHVVQAADEFHMRAQQASLSADEMSPEEQVPLYKCSVLVRSSTGTLYVTATQLLFVTQFIPIVGGQTCTIFDFAGLEFTIHEGSTSLLSSPLPSSISVSMEGEEVYSFRPSHGAHRLVAFLRVVQAMANPGDADGLTFSDRGGLLYLYGDGNLSPLR